MEHLNKPFSAVINDYLRLLTAVATQRNLILDCASPGGVEIAAIVSNSKVISATCFPPIN